MKWRVLVAILVIGQFARAGDGVKVGFGISPSLRINAHHSKIIKTWQFQTGYGFNAGIPVRVTMLQSAAKMGFTTGLFYDYTAFDQLQFGVLASSFRLSGVQVPIMINYPIRGTWFADFGGGVTYYFLTTGLSGGYRVNINSDVQQFQPWLGFGVHNLIERGAGNFELGLNIRAAFLELFEKDYPGVAAATSNILCIDGNIRFYFSKKNTKGVIDGTE